MSSWSRNRKFTYITIFLILAVAAIGVPAFLIFYHPATCFDGTLNGDEQGIDCGGSCQRLCPSSFLSPSVAWARLEQVDKGLYNVAAYIINPNTAAEAVKTPYHAVLYDDKGSLITEFNGTVTLPPHRNTLAFMPAVSSGKQVPSKVLFEFAAPPNWVSQADLLSPIQIGDKKYTEDDSGSALQVTLTNTSVNPIGRLSVYAVLYDKDGNALGFSKTVIDGISGNSAALAPFTWPINRHGAVISIEVLPVLE